MPKISDHHREPLALLALCVALALLLGGLGREWVRRTADPGSAGGTPIQDPSRDGPPETRPYEAREVRLEGEAGPLEGILTLPRTTEPVPGVLLISGAGAQDRDGTFGRHKRLLVLADALSRCGLGVLRLDDRGVGGSGGDLLSSTIDDLAGDARRAADFLRAQREIDGRRVGLLGGSHGGLVALRAAAAEAFVVLYSTPGVPGREIFVEQNLAVMAGQGIDEEALSEARGLLEESLGLALAAGESAPHQDETHQDETYQDEARRRGAILSRRLHGLGYGGALPLPPEALRRQVEVLLSPSMHSTLTFDTGHELRRLTVPVLAVAGTLDMQVPPEPNLTAIRKALETGHPASETVLLPDLNHFLQPAKTGHPSEYDKIPWTISTEVLERTCTWIGGLWTQDGDGDGSEAGPSAEGDPV